ncbi:MAG: hypothetical protein Q8P91_01935 [bacterium]|nr:hypothetical protein [bacterium]
MLPEQSIQLNADIGSRAGSTVKDIRNKMVDGILQAAGMEKDDWKNYSFRLGRIKIWDNDNKETFLQLDKMGLVEDGRLKLPVIIVSPKDGNPEQAVKDDWLKLKFNFLHGENSVPYFTLGCEESNAFISLSGLWLSVLSDGSLFAATRFKRDVPDYFPVSTDFTEPFINCLGISSERAFGVTLPQKAVNLLDIMTRRVDLDPKNLSKAEQADYQMYLEELRQPAKTDLIQKITDKYGEKPVVFDGDMEAEFKVYSIYCNEKVEKTLAVIIKDIAIPEIIWENMGREVTNIVRPKTKPNQTKGDLRIWVRERSGIFSVILEDDSLAFFDVNSFNKPEKLAAILAKINIDK